MPSGITNLFSLINIRLFLLELVQKNLCLSMNLFISCKLSKFIVIKMVVIFLFFFPFFIFLKMKWREKNSLLQCLRTRDKTNLKSVSPGSSECDSYCVDSSVRTLLMPLSYHCVSLLFLIFCLVSVGSIVMFSPSFLILIICDISPFKNQYVWSFIKFIDLSKQSAFCSVDFIFHLSVSYFSVSTSVTSLCGWACLSI